MPRMDLPILPVSDFSADAGRRLRKVIKLLGLKQTEAAELMGVTKWTLQNWLDGDSPPQPYPIYRFARLKGVDFNYIFLGDHSRLPADLARKLEDEAIARLAATSAADHQAT